MYYASLVAYHIFFNSTKYLYFLLLLISSLLYIFVLAKEMGNIKEWAALYSSAATNDGNSTFWEFLHPSQISPSHHSNHSYFKLSTSVSTFSHIN
ncbi:hypothetical protein ES332_D13G153000v1 [Gossypium tomentosum]|uniref:Uncharacterized protein n=1 Tax=Gossypium tomentosum TaxID=34277 RepID=A0A5D2HXF9_GOSTO|nr:hypothetical protein ES332_D13G153000v1 [Gossypium tomentosum]